MACNAVSCKMNDLCHMEDICCLNKVLVDFRCAMKNESKAIVIAIDRLIGDVCNDEGTGSLSALIRVIRQHKKLLCSIKKNCDKDCDSGCCNKHKGKYDENKCCLSLCSCTDDDACCPKCNPTLLDLLDDIKRLNDSRVQLLTFQKDMTDLLNAIFRYYGSKGCKQPCLPECDEMFKYIMYLVKLCVKNCECKSASRKCVCKVCKPDPTLYPVVFVIFVALYFGNTLHKYVELYCACCVNQRKCGGHADASYKNITVSFTKNTIHHFKRCDDQISGTLRGVEIFDSCNNLLGTADLALCGSTKMHEERHAYTANVAGVVGDRDCNINGAIHGLIVGTYCEEDKDCAHSTGILCGTLVELEARDPCTTVRNPYDDAQAGLCGMVSILDKLNAEKMVEIVGDNFAAYGKRLC